MVKRSVPVYGFVAPGFEPVREEFLRNFEEHGELGAACAIYRQGEKVVDLWGGYRDGRSRAPWEEDTLVLVFSSTKGLSALALAHSCGYFDYDAPVAHYWPGDRCNAAGVVLRGAAPDLSAAMRSASEGGA